MDPNCERGEFELAKGAFQHHTKAGIKKKTVRAGQSQKVKKVVVAAENIPETQISSAEMSDVKVVKIIQTRKGPVVKPVRPKGIKKQSNK